MMALNADEHVPSKRTFSLCQQLKEAYPNKLFQELEFVGIVGIESRPVQRGRLRDVLDGDLVELLLLQETPQGVL